MLLHAGTAVLRAARPVSHGHMRLAYSFFRDKVAMPVAHLAKRVVMTGVDRFSQITCTSVSSMVHFAIVPLFTLIVVTAVFSNCTSTELGCCRDRDACLHHEVPIKSMAQMRLQST